MSLIFLDEVEIFGQRLIQPGDAVDLVPIELMEARKDYGQCKNKVIYNLLLRWLGKGPYRVERIGIWPCGRTVLFLKAFKRDPMVFSDHFM